MENIEGNRMKVSWALADNTFLDPTVDIEQLKGIGSFWGSWRTWRSCATDNVICSDPGQARNLIKRDFQKTCNLYVPQSAYTELDRPAGIKLYGGEFHFEIDNPDELITLHLAASQSDIVLLLGFDWTTQPKKEDRLLEHRAQNYRIGANHAIKDNPDTQWVLIDHSSELMSELDNLENLTIDTLKNVLDMLSS